jgi:large subunit ribosomal protein L23
MSVNNQLLAHLVRPLFTEKAFSLSLSQQYLFEVSMDANKVQLKQAFERAFPGRRVLSVKVLKIPGKTRRFGKRTVAVPARRKAIFKVEGEPLPMFTAGIADYAS